MYIYKIINVETEHQSLQNVIQTAHQSTSQEQGLHRILPYIHMNQALIKSNCASTQLTAALNNKVNITRNVNSA